MGDKTRAVVMALAALFAVLIVGCIFNAHGAFFQIGTHRDTLRQASVYGILACGMTLVIITGGIDLAVGSVLGMVAVVFSMTTIWWGWSPWLTVPLALAIGAACGAVSGTLVAGPKLQPFIATLAMMVFARGLAKTLTGGVKAGLSVPKADGTFAFADVPGVFRAIDSRILGDNVAVVTVIFLLVVVVTGVLLSRHIWGRDLYAIGGNEEAARLSGLPVVRAKILAYTACGLCAAIAAICQAAQEQQGDPEVGAGYELTAIAIVVIGGTNLMGGRGSIWLTLVGTLTIGYMEKILSVNAVPEAGRLLLTGAIIVAAVLLQRRGRQ
jgi:ribose transport system permease protein